MKSYIMSNKLAKYYLGGITDLSQNIDTHILNNPHYYVRVIAYKITPHYDTPILNYVLLNIKKMFILPTIFLFNQDYMNSDELANYCKKEFISIIKKQNANNRECENIEFKGFLYDDINREISIFLDLTQTRWTVYDSLLSSDKVWFGTVDEILNKKNICNIRIHNTVTDFLTNNKNFCFIFDENNRQVEIPVIAYCGKHSSDLDYIYNFGLSQSDDKQMYGPYYYFTDYYNSIKEGGWSPDQKPEYRNDKLITVNEYGKYNKGGVVRIALFMNKMKIIDENTSNDDSTEYTSFADKIADKDGKWANTYDSVFVILQSKIPGKEKYGVPVYVVKQYEQQKPLSYHLLNMKQLGEEYEFMSNYEIM